MSDYDERVLDLCDMDYDSAAETLAYIDRLREESAAARGIIATERGYRVRAEAEAAARHAGNDDVAAWLRAQRDRLAKAGASDSVLDAVHELMDAWRPTTNETGDDHG